MNFIRPLPKNATEVWPLRDGRYGLVTRDGALIISFETKREAMKEWRRRNCGPTIKRNHVYGTGEIDHGPPKDKGFGNNNPKWLLVAMIIMGASIGPLLWLVLSR